MHYYKRHIGDYHKKAGRLSILQHGTYTLLIDACYDRERFPTLEEAIDWVWASSDDEIQAVEFVLKRFFDLDENGKYVQTRIAEELEHYAGICAKNKQIADERETKRREKSTKRAPSVDEAPPNHKPLTTNQEPVNNSARFHAPTVDEVRAYCQEKGYTLDPERFVNFYESKGWMVGKTKMKKWKAAVANWEKSNKQEAAPKQDFSRIALEAPEL